MTTSTTADREQVRRALLDLLAALADVGQVAPCRSGPLSARAAWTAESAAAQRAAARACAHCPARDPCGSYGARWPEEHGVYGGLTEHVRRTTEEEDPT